MSAQAEVVYPIAFVPLEAECCVCGHRNGDLQFSYANGVPIGPGRPFSQPMIHYGADRWAHVGCASDEAADRDEERRLAEQDYAEALADHEATDDDRPVRI